MGLLKAWKIKSPRTLGTRTSLDLDLLRGVSAIFVLVSHWRYLLFKDFDPEHVKGVFWKFFYFITSLGHQAVMVFFVLSGFLVGGSVMRSVAQERWSWKKYFADRVSRLYIVLVPALLLGWALDAYGSQHYGLNTVYGGLNEFKLIIDHKHAVPNVLTPWVFLGNLFMTQHAIALGPTEVPTFGSNGPLWSLACEFWYYVLFPCLYIGIFGKGGKAGRIAMVILALIVLLMLHSIAKTLFLVWLMGALLAALELPDWLGSKPVRIVGMIAMLGGLVMNRALVSSYLLPADVALGVVTTFWVASLVMQPEPAKPAGKARTWISRKLSEVSYTGYLVHLPLLILMIAGIIGAGPRWTPTYANVLRGSLLFVPIAFYIVLIWWLFEHRTHLLRTALYRLLRIPERSKSGG